LVPTASVGRPLDAAGALRVLVEEIRADVESRLQTPTRTALPLTAPADPGNAAAALLRWLRAASDGRVPLDTLREIVEGAYARALAEAVPAPARPPAAAGPGPAPTTPTAMPPAMNGPAPGAGAESLPSGEETPVHAALATARELVLRGLATASPTAAQAVSSVAPRAVPGAAPSAGANAAAPTAPAASPPAAIRAEAEAATDRQALPVRGPATPAPPSAGTPPRAPALTSAEALRVLVEQVRARLVGAAGPARLPNAPPPLVTDPHGAALGPALVRWLTAAVAEKGVALGVLQEAVRGAHADAEARAAPAGGESGTPAADDEARAVLRTVRDFVLRALGAPPERDGRPETRVEGRAAVTPAAAAPVVADPRGVPVVAGTTVRREDRVEAVEPRARRTRSDDRDAPSEPEAGPAAGGPAAEDEVQGPLECVRRYFEAFHAGDGAAYAAQWVYPACVWSDGRWTAFATPAACASGIDAHVQSARARGMAGGRILMLRVEPMAQDVAVVHGLFTRDRADGSVLHEVEAAYTTVRTADGWRVAVCVVKSGASLAAPEPSLPRLPAR
jgi:hypothetical protein